MFHGTLGRRTGAGLVALSLALAAAVFVAGCKKPDTADASPPARMSETLMPPSFTAGRLVSVLSAESLLVPLVRATISTPSADQSGAPRGTTPTGPVGTFCRPQ